jgi:hypothetical protein
MLSEGGGNQNGTAERTQINIVDPTHPLAAGLSGTVTVFNSPQWTQYGLGELADGVDLIAEATENPAEHAIFAADVGDTLLGDGSDGFPATAAGRRVMFFISDQGFGELTADGLKLFDAAVSWAANKAQGVAGDFNENGVLDADDIDTLSLGIRNATVDPNFDLNNDQAINDGDRTYWVNDLKHTYFGDSNLDGEFNSADFVFVFTTGRYETGRPAGWGAGDWNGDGLFDSSDFVKAFSGGGYELGPKGATHAIPEPSAWLLVLFAVPLVAARRPLRSSND